MESYLYPHHYDLVTPDGTITSIRRLPDGSAEVTLFIQNISPAFVGYHLDLKNIHFNIKSTLAQLGVNGIGKEYSLDPKLNSAEVKVLLIPIGDLAKQMIALLDIGAQIGRLFAADQRRRVRDPDYLTRMFGRSDRKGRPLLSLGGMQGSTDLILDVIDGRAVAYVTLQEGCIQYTPSVKGLLPTLAKGLITGLRMRELLALHQVWKQEVPRNLTPNEILLVRTQPLHIRTVFGRVVQNLLPKGCFHTTADILQPDTMASGDIYEVYGTSNDELNDIPLEFYTLEPHREYVFFSDRDQLQTGLENAQTLFKAFASAPAPETHHASVFVVKGDQLLNLSHRDWICRTPRRNELPGITHSARQELMIERFINQQSSYPFLKAIDDGLITSEGILLTRYFPSPFMKRMLLSDSVQRCLKRIYFQHPSLTGGEFFSHEDHALLNDLSKFAIPVYWVDKVSGKILQYIRKPGKDCGMFVPLKQVDTFLKATTLGVYGSNLLEGNFEKELMKLLSGLLKMQTKLSHPFMNKDTPLALVTGGGPGAMEVGNRVAQKLGILSCANIVDFQSKTDLLIKEQKQNPHVEAKMTYRLSELVERQSEFNLDFPIFLMGGIGTDFEFALEELRRKVGSTPAHPIMLFGSDAYWKQKITSPFRCNAKNGTIAGSEWVSNCLYAIQSAEEGLEIYRQFFEGTLPIGKGGPLFKDGFCKASDRKPKVQKKAKKPAKKSSDT